MFEIKNKNIENDFIVVCSFVFSDIKSVLPR